MQDAILKMYPGAERIIHIQSYRPGYLPYPARATVQLTGGEQVCCVLKVGANEGRIAHEKNVLQALNELKFPAPAVLGSGHLLADNQKPMAAILLSEMPGNPLPWIKLNDLSIAYKTCQLLCEAVDKLHGLTSRLLSHPVSAMLPKKTLSSELETIQGKACGWLHVPIFKEALSLMQSVIPKTDCPLVFSNGDYNPLNFLAANSALSGWIDFEYACYEDPYIGFAKFFLWANDEIGWGAGAKSGLVERYMYEHQVAPVEFLSRLILRGLYYVHECSIAQPPAYMLDVIQDAVRRLKSSIR